MHEIHFISKPRSDHRSVRYAFFASLVFHGLAMGSVLALMIYYRSHLPLIKKGSPSGSTTISLQKMVVVPPPIIPPAPPATVIASAPPPPISVITPREIAVEPPAPSRITDAPKPSEEGVPVLLLAPPPPVRTPQPRIVKTAAPMINSPAKQPPAKPKTVPSLASSSYMPGREDLPHPPYPLEARDRHETGTVVMAVRFDADGGVEQARVSQSSGVPVLDSETKSFIRANWHSLSLAGQTISVPVRYTLQQL
jgi:TonB family protein